MNSKSLTHEGFNDWLEFALASRDSLSRKLPNCKGVYVIKNRRSFGRFIGKSDIVYLGSASNKDGLKKRILMYFHPGSSQWTNHRINKLLDGRHKLSLSFVCKRSPMAAKGLEHSLLKKYYEEHRELPPQNRRE